MERKAIEEKRDALYNSYVHQRVQNDEADAKLKQHRKVEEQLRAQVALLNELLAQKAEDSNHSHEATAE